MRSGTLHPQTRVGIVSREPIRLAGLISVFDGHPTVIPVAEGLETLLQDEELHLLILDVTNSYQWQEILAMVQRTRPDIRKIILGPKGNEELVLRSIMAGARAYLDHDTGPVAIRQAVDVVLQGLIWAPRRLLSTLIDRLLAAPGGASVPDMPMELSPRERQVLELIMKAYSNREIALELGIEERTVKAHVANLMRKSGVGNRVSLSVQATQGFMPDRGPQSN